MSEKKNDHDLLKKILDIEDRLNIIDKQLKGLHFSFGSLVNMLENTGNEEDDEEDEDEKIEEIDNKKKDTNLKK